MLFYEQKNRITSILGTDIDRTLMSAAAILSGLFPPTGGQVWNENLLWQPIPVHTVPKSLDYVLNAEANCPRFNEALKRFEESSEFQAVFSQHKDLFEYLEVKTGMPIRTLDHIQDLNNTLWVQSITSKTYESNTVVGF